MRSTSPWPCWEPSTRWPRSWSGGGRSTASPTGPSRRTVGRLWDRWCRSCPEPEPGGPRLQPVAPGIEIEAGVPDGHLVEQRLAPDGVPRGGEAEELQLPRGGVLGERPPLGRGGIRLGQV